MMIFQRRQHCVDLMMCFDRIIWLNQRRLNWDIAHLSSEIAENLVVVASCMEDKAAKSRSQIIEITSYDFITGTYTCIASIDWIIVHIEHEIWKLNFNAVRLLFFISSFAIHWLLIMIQIICIEVCPHYVLKYLLQLICKTVYALEASIKTILTTFIQSLLKVHHVMRD